MFQEAYAHAYLSKYFYMLPRHYIWPLQTLLRKSDHITIDTDVIFYLFNILIVQYCFKIVIPFKSKFQNIFFVKDFGILIYIIKCFLLNYRFIMKGFINIKLLTVLKINEEMSFIKGNNSFHVKETFRKYFKFNLSCGPQNDCRVRFNSIERVSKTTNDL